MGSTPAGSKRQALRSLIAKYGDGLVPEMLRVFDPELQERYHESGPAGLTLPELVRLLDRVKYLVKKRIVLPPPRPLPPNPCGKARYQTETLANTVVNNIWQTGRGRMRVYACPRCEGWHLTHKPLVK